MKLIDLLPVAYLNSLEMAKIQEVVGRQVETAEKSRDTLQLQVDLETATAALGRWEKKWDIPEGIGLSLEERRSKVKSRMRGYGTCKVGLLQSVTESFANGSVLITEMPREGKVEIKFISTLGTPKNMEDVKAAVDEVMPAHIEYTFVFTYRQYRALKEYAYGHLGGTKYQRMREGTIA